MNNTGSTADLLDAAMNVFQSALREVRSLVDETPTLSDQDRAEGYQYLAGLLAWVLERAITNADPNAPYFMRWFDGFTKFGLDNPDNLYVSAEISDQPHEGNWLKTEPGAKIVLGRQCFSDWATQVRGEMDISRPGFEGKATPPLTIEAMLVSFPPCPARYQGFQLGHRWWFHTFDYRCRQSSLNGAQARLSSDGMYHYVISANDPGVPNWLDTAGHSQALISIRWQGLGDQVPVPPTTEIVKLANLRQYFPADEPAISAQQRCEQIAIRQKSVNRRFSS